MVFQYLLFVSLLSTCIAQIQKPASLLEYDYYEDAVFDEGPDIPSHAQAAKPGEFRCPRPNGDFEDPKQCDKYWRCKNSVPHALLCEDGLVFDSSKADGRDEPCDSPYVVDCKERTLLQEPTFPSKFCLRRHGFFADPDPKVCNVFYTCIKGLHTRTQCSPTLHFNEKTGTCTWPTVAGRTDCGEAKRQQVNGFTCPVEEVLNDQGMKIPHPSYPNLDDCQKFYVCLNGETPQEAACTLGQVFNERSMLCDKPRNVPECIDWYKNDPRFEDQYYYYDDISPKGSADVGLQDVAA